MLLPSVQTFCQTPCRQQGYILSLYLWLQGDISSSTMRAPWWPHQGCCPQQPANHLDPLLLWRPAIKRGWFVLTRIITRYHYQSSNTYKNYTNKMLWKLNFITKLSFEFDYRVLSRRLRTKAICGNSHCNTLIFTRKYNFKELFKWINNYICCIHAITYFIMWWSAPVFCFTYRSYS
jgi:hypothetical protein